MSRPRRPSVGERIVTATRRLAETRPLAEIRLTDVARESGVSWPTVKRHVGGRDGLRALVEQGPADLAAGKPDTRLRLIEAAERVFAARGYEAATLDDIAAEAGLTKGALYWHFASKSDLFVTLLTERSEPEPEPALDAGSSARHAVYRILSHAIGRAQSSRDAAELAFELCARHRVPEVGRALSERVAERTAATSALIAALQAEQVVGSDVDARAAARLLSAVANGLVFAALVDPELDLRTFLPEVSRLLERGLGR